MNREASKALGGSDGKAPSIFQLWTQPEGKGFDDRTEDVKDAEGLKHCGMRSDLICRRCHDTTCKIRIAPQVY